MSNGDTERRLFFALYPGAEQRERLAAIARERLPAGAGKFVTPANLHFTLVFLGNISAATVRCLVQATADLTAAPPVSVQIDRIGYWRRPRILWAGATRTPAGLPVLVERLRAVAATCGIRPDDRPYELHMTLVRKVNLPVTGFTLTDPVRLDFDRFVLMESVATAAESRYETVASWPLQTGTGPEK